MKNNLIVIGFFCLYFLLGLCIVKDYGISWDEPTERFTSIEQYKFAVSKLFSLFHHESALIGELMHNWQMLQGYPDRYYGTFLHWPLVALEHWTGFTQQSREIFYLRHLNTFVYFFIAAMCLFKIVKKRFASDKLGILAVLMLVTSPRFFAESFYNNKDILFASWYMIGIYVSLWYLETTSLKRALITGIILGIGINTRIMAILLWVMIGISLLMTLKKSTIIKAAVSLMVIIAVSLATYIITMPTAWGNEFGFLLDAFHKFAHFNWFGKTLYLNGFAEWNSIPWHYIPVYAWATTPLWYSVLFILGLAIFIKHIITHRKKVRYYFTPLFSIDFFLVMSAVLPLVAVIVLRSVVYDSWRHMYFMYLPMVYGMVYGIHHGTTYKKYLVGISLVVIGINSIWMIHNHPYQFLYFNPIARIHASDNFERDYWGVVTLDHVEYILENDPRSEIKIWKNDYMFKHIDLMLNKDEKARFTIVPNKSESDYLTHYFHNTRERSWSEPGFEEIRSIEVDGVRAQTLYKRTALPID